MFEKSLLLHGLECFYEGVGTTPLQDSQYGCGSRTPIFEWSHPSSKTLSAQYLQITILPFSS